MLCVKGILLKNVCWHALEKFTTVKVNVNSNIFKLKFWFFKQQIINLKENDKYTNEFSRDMKVR